MNIFTLSARLNQPLKWLPSVLMIIASQTGYPQEKAAILPAGLQIKQPDGSNNLLSVPDDENWDNRLGFPNTRYEESGHAIAVIDSEIYLGGSIPAKNYVVQWNVNGWSALGHGPNSIVNALAVIGNDLYVGGIFVMVDGVVANRIAKWNHLTQKWSVLKNDTSIGIDNHVEYASNVHNVQAMAVRDHDLYMGGRFTHAGGIVANNIVKWNSLSNTWLPLGDGINGTVSAIAVRDGEVYVGGRFSSAGGVPANNIAKWNGRKWSAVGGGVNNIVYAISCFGKDVYVGGSFTEAGEVQAKYIAKWNTADNRWSALGGNGMNGSNRVVLAIGSNKRFVYVGGDIDLADGQKIVGIAKWDPVNSLWSAMGSGVYGWIKSIVTRGNDVLVAGTILKVGGKDSKNFGVWHEPYGRPAIAVLPELRFNEDRILFHPIRDWHPFVTDDDDADSTLKFTVLSGRQVKTTRHPRRYAFSAPANWFGRDTLQVIVTDPSQLADTTALVVTVDPTNDKPKWTGLPDSLAFKTGASAQLKMWDLVEDLETPDSLLLYRFSTNKPGLRWNFHRATGTLVLTAPQFHGKADLFVKAGDGNAAAYDTIAVRVEMPNDILAAIEKQNSAEQIPSEFVLQQNYPNPFNPTTLIRFGLPHEAEVKLEILNLAGQHVATLLNERKAAGYHEVLFEAAHLPSGNYFTVLRAGEMKLVRRIVLMK